MIRNKNIVLSIMLLVGVFCLANGMKKKECAGYLFEPIVENCKHKRLDEELASLEVAMIRFAADVRREEEKNQKDINTKKPPFILVLNKTKK